jgi:hypothetical protein
MISEGPPKRPGQLEWAASRSRSAATSPPAAISCARELGQGLPACAQAPHPEVLPSVRADSPIIGNWLAQAERDAGNAGMGLTGEREGVCRTDGPVGADLQRLRRHYDADRWSLAGQLSAFVRANRSTGRHQRLTTLRPLRRLGLPLRDAFCGIPVHQAQSAGDTGASFLNQATTAGDVGPSLPNV